MLGELNIPEKQIYLKQNSSFFSEEKELGISSVTHADASMQKSLW